MLFIKEKLFAEKKLVFDMKGSEVKIAPPAAAEKPAGAPAEAGKVKNADLTGQNDKTKQEGKKHVDSAGIALRQIPKLPDAAGPQPGVAESKAGAKEMTLEEKKKYEEVCVGIMTLIEGERGHVMTNEWDLNQISEYFSTLINSQNKKFLKPLEKNPMFYTVDCGQKGIIVMVIGPKGVQKTELIKH